MSKVKGIILAGGYGTRLFPLTYASSKQLLPVYDKPMVYYPLSILMNLGIKEILIISTDYDLPNFKKLLKNGNHLGLNITYKAQNTPRGIAESFIIAEDFIGSDNDICLVLGDNIFYGDNLNENFNLGITNLKKNLCTIFTKEVENPENFGVVSYDEKGNILKIIEKPLNPTSNYIVSGLYFYKNSVVKVAKKLKPSLRNELEITDINNHYINKKCLKIIKLDNSVIWTDTGTYSSLLDASRFFEDLEEKTAKKYACVEEIAFLLDYIDRDKFVENAMQMKNSNYGKYLFKILEFEDRKNKV